MEGNLSDARGPITCGCKVVFDMAILDEQPTGMRLVSCPLHASAPRMLEALEKIRLMIAHGSTYGMGGRIKEIIDSVLAEAKGEK